MHHTRFRLAPAALLGALIVVSPALRAETAAPAADATPATTNPAVEKGAEIEQALTALIERVKGKLQSGQTTPAALADELKAFDELTAKYASEKTDAVAMIGVMKAMLYLQVFDDQATGVAQLKQVAKDFPETQAAKNIGEMIAEIEANAAAEAALAVGKPFPTFKEKATDGSDLDLAAYKGKIVLIDFWATWCGPCVGELPHVKAAYDKYHAQGFEIIGISLDKDADKLAAFVKEHQMGWPQYFDGQGWQNKLSTANGIRSIPATFLLDRDGNIAAKDLRGDALSEKVAALLAASPAK